MANQTLPAYKADFLKAALDGGVLKFGTFELKSKRISPYFFNTGEFYSGKLVKALSAAYAHTIADAHASGVLDFDLLFGPAYKGIPLVATTTLALSQLEGRKYDDIMYAFDRKEAKDHGEGGNFVGAPIKRRKVLIIDDVVSAGTAKREAIGKIQSEGGVVAGIVVALDRQETLPSSDSDASSDRPSAIGALRKEYGIPIISVLTLDDILAGVKGLISEDDIKRVEEYRAKYKASD
ncbi:phosphoribosyltransferase-like protein [Immersiella caudata]|uniref:Orotate phosphoribosyltransferase n=1 Tax=Immersiella caudata TaxID=314043 RepID=A0AA39WQR9_9PEZI|nr:phosphoribosyltransferase-like protein [Immersiella caudata]